MFLHEKTAVSLEKTTDIEYIINLAGQNWFYIINIIINNNPNYLCNYS